LEAIRRLEDLRVRAPSVVTVGVFDGVHVGHQAIMRIVKADAAELGARSVVVTFDRDPEELVYPTKAAPHLTTLRRKVELIAEQGMDLAVVLPLGGWLIDMPAERFVSSILYEKLSAVQIVVGANFAFGKDRAGDARLLRKMGRDLGFGVVEVSPIKVDSLLVSSTAIRKLLADGKIELANVLLGHPFVLEGRVIAGDGIGRSIGYPTANVEPVREQIVPGGGVYAVSVKVGDTTWTGVANIGARPTIGSRGTGIEVYLIGFSGDLYGRELAAVFHHRLRDEIKFPDVEALKSQIARDIEQTSRLVV